MRTVRRLGALIALFAALAAPATSVAATPAETVQSALDSMNAATPYKLLVDGSATIKLNREGLPLSVSLTEQFSAQSHVESPTRARWTFQEAIALFDGAGIVYDGRIVVRDDERRYRALSDEDLRIGKLIMEPASQLVRPTSASELEAIVDAGPGTIDGVLATKYTAVLPAAFMRRLVERLLSEADLSAADRAETLNTISFRPGTFELWVDGSGRTWRETVTMAAGIDLKAALEEGVESGDGGLGLASADVELRLSFHPHDFGTPITIPVPRARPVQEIVPDAGEFRDSMALSLLRGADNAMRTYAIVNGSYAGASTKVLGELAPWIRFRRSGRTLAARNQVLLRIHSSRRFSVSTTSATRKVFTLTKTLNGPTTITCRIGRRTCKVPDAF